MEKRYIHKHGATIWALLSVSLVRDAQRQPRHFISQIQDITERKQADATRALLAAIVDSSDDAIIGVTLDGTVLSWNSGAEQLYGYRADQMIGKPIATLWPPQGQDEVTQLNARLARGETTAHFETVRMRSDGQLIDVALTISAITTASGSVSGFSTIARDISARKRAEHRLRQTTAFVQLLQDVAVAANQAVSLDQALQTALAAICTQIGWPIGHVYLPDPDRSGTLLPSRIWYLDDAQRFATFRTITEGVRLAPGIGLPGRVLTSRKPAWIADMILDVSTPRTTVIKDLGVRAGFALPVLLGDEVAAVLEFFATTAIEPDDALLNVLQHVGTELGRVVERARAEAALRAAEAQYRALVEQMPAIIYTAAIDETSTTQYVSPQIEAILGFSPAEWIANPGLWLEQAHPDDRARLLENVGRVQASDVATPTEYRSYTRDGRLVWLRDTERVVCDAAGQPLFVQGITLDITDRKQAEAAAAEREAYFRALIEHSADAIALLAVDGTIRYGSPATPRILGYTLQAFVGRNAFDLIHPDDRAQFAEQLGQIAGVPEATVTIQARVQHADGSWRDLEGMFTNLLADPAVHAIVTNYRDISERKRAEIAVRESERRYRTLASNFPNGAVVLFDHDLRFTIADGTGLADIGLSPERLEGHTLWEIYPPEGRVVNEPIFRAALAGTPSIREVTSGAVTLVIHTLPVRDEHGAIIAGMLMSQNITERKRIEEALRLSAARFRAVWDGAHDAMVLSDPDGMVLEANPAYVQLYGYTSDQIIGHPYNIIFPAEQRGAAMEAYHAFFRDPSSLLHVESQIQRADGTARWVESSVSFLLQDGQRTALLSLIRDITERKGLEAALLDERALLARRVDERTADLRAANAELVRAVHLKDAFLASMSHELRTPLNAILGLSEALQEQIYGPLSAQQLKTLGYIETSGRHLLALINDILDLAKLGAGMLELTIEPVAVETICQSSVLLIKQSAHTKHLTVTTTIDPAVVQIPADARRLKQILVNLLANAVKFTPDGGAIGLDITGDPTQQLVRFTVWDTGIGIAEDQLPKLWQAFVQLDSRLARQYEGTGLGLALVAQMVELHGGSVTVTSTVGVGSRFTVALPWVVHALEHTHAPMQHERAADPLGQAVVHPRADAAPVILLAEDNEANRTFIVDYLTLRGYQVVTARNGTEALERAHEARPALILMDIQMPGIDGLEATRRIRAEEPLAAIPIIALTALAMVGDRERCLVAGANDYLSKPIRLRELVAMIDRHLCHPVVDEEPIDDTR